MSNAPSYRPRPDTPLGRVFALIDKEIRHTATIEEIGWLRDHPELWLKALKAMKATVNAKTRMAKEHLESMRPEPGTNPSDKYLERKREVASQNIWRYHASRALGVRINEAKSILGFQSVSHITTGDVYAGFLEIMELAKVDDYEQIRKIAKSWCIQLDGERAREDIPPYLEDIDDE